MWRFGTNSIPCSRPYLSCFLKASSGWQIRSGTSEAVIQNTLEKVTTFKRLRVWNLMFLTKKMDFCHWAIFPKILYYESAFWVDKFEITTMFSNKAVVDSYNLLFCKFATAKQTLWKHCLNWPKCWCHGFGKQKDDFKALVNLDKTNISNKMLSCKTQQEGKQFRKNAANSTAINSMWWPYLV